MGQCSRWIGGCLVLLTGLVGCGREVDTQVVDFAKTVNEPQAVAYRPVDREPLKVAVAAMISPRETVVNYHRLLEFVASRLGRPLELVQRKTYREVNELLGHGRIDLAFICSGPYATARKTYGFRAVAIPQVRGRHRYSAYLIVNRDSAYQTLADLRGKVFAFTDPESNTGCLVPTFWLAEIGEDPEQFFGQTIYTYSHDNSILAVAEAMVDGASVHEQIWEYYQRKNPVHTSRTRIIKRSTPFGNPVFVVSKNVDDAVFARLQRCFFSMHLDPDGSNILKELLIERFTPADEAWYAPIQAMQHRIRQEASFGLDTPQS